MSDDEKIAMLATICTKEFAEVCIEQVGRIMEAQPGIRCLLRACRLNGMTFGEGMAVAFVTANMQVKIVQQQLTAASDGMEDPFDAVEDMLRRVTEGK